MALSQEIIELLRLRGQLGQQKKDRWAGWLNPIQESIRGIGQKLEARRTREDEQAFTTSERLGGEAFTTSERLGGEASTTSERLGGEAFSEKMDKWLNLQANRREALGAARGAEADKESRLATAAENQKGRTSAEGMARSSRELQIQLASASRTASWDQLLKRIETEHPEWAGLDPQGIRDWILLREAAGGAPAETSSTFGQTLLDAKDAAFDYLATKGLLNITGSGPDWDKLTQEDINAINATVADLVDPMLARGKLNQQEANAIKEIIRRAYMLPTPDEEAGSIPAPSREVAQPPPVSALGGRGVSVLRIPPALRPSGLPHVSAEELVTAEERPYVDKLNTLIATLKSALSGKRIANLPDEKEAQDIATAEEVLSDIYLNSWTSRAITGESGGRAGRAGLAEKLRELLRRRNL